MTRPRPWLVGDPVTLGNLNTFQDPPNRKDGMEDTGSAFQTVTDNDQLVEALAQLKTQTDELLEFARRSEYERIRLQNEVDRLTEQLRLSEQARAVELRYRRPEDKAAAITQARDLLDVDLLMASTADLLNAILAARVALHGAEAAVWEDD